MQNEKQPPPTSLKKFIEKAQVSLSTSFSWLEIIANVLKHVLLLER